MEWEFFKLTDEWKIWLNANELLSVQKEYSDKANNETWEALKEIYEKDLEEFNSLVDNIIKQINKLNNKEWNDPEKLKFLIEFFNNLLNNFINNSRSYSELISELENSWNLLAKKVSVIVNNTTKRNAFDKIYDKNHELYKALLMADWKI